MTTTSAVAAATAASRARAPEAPDHATALFHAAQLLLPDLERGHRIDAAKLRAAMEQAFGGSDSQGTWDWKGAYDACEAAAVLFLRKFGATMAARAGSPAALLPMLAKVAGLLPSHTRRSEDSETFQQFSTPLPLRHEALKLHRPDLRAVLLTLARPLGALARGLVPFRKQVGQNGRSLSHIYPAPENA